MNRELKNMKKLLIKMKAPNKQKMIAQDLRDIVHKKMSEEEFNETVRRLMEHDY
ncbi:MAG: hypothetical protein Q4B63_10690 [Clostridium perfringens]|nr:hypothetical protein [Clostridium perfringens]